MDSLFDILLGKSLSGGSGGPSDYSDLSNKPQINDTTLSGNLSSADLGLQSNTMTGYEEAQTASAIATTDTVLQAIGKLEKGEDDNKANIVLVEQMNGAKNLCDWANVNEKIRQGISSAIKTDTSLAVTSSGAWGHIAYTIGTLSAGEYVAIAKITNYSVASATCRFGIASETNKTTPISGNGVVTYSFSLDDDTLISLYFYANWSATSYINSYTASDIMIITKAAYDAGFTDYQPYALSNAEL